MSYDYLCKIILIGNTGVGKTSYCDRLAHNKYDEMFIPTLGVDFFSKHVKLDDNTVLKTHIWDTAGQEKFNGIITHYYKDIAGAIIIFDIGSRYTFTRVNYWKNEIIKKMNAFFGYEVVRTIKLNTFDGFLEKKLKKSADYATKNKHIKDISNIKNEKIRNSLIELSNLYKKK